MQTILSIIGAIAVIIVLLLVIGFFWIKHKFKQLLDQPQITQAISITLEDEPDPEWMDEQQVVEHQKDFVNHRFDSLGIFRVPELNDTLLHCFYRSEDRITGVITEMPGASVLTEIGMMFDDETAIDVTSAPQVNQMHQRPGQTKIYVPDPDCEQLLAKLATLDTAGKQAIQVSVENIKSLIEESYHKDTAWLYGRGGPSKAEIRKIAGPDVDDEAIEETYLIQREQYIEANREIALQQWAKEQKISALALDEMEQPPVVVNEFMTRDELIEAFEETWYLTFEQRRAIEELGSPDQMIALLFDQKFAEIFPQSGFEVVAEITKPVPARLYGIKARQSAAA